MTLRKVIIDSGNMTVERAMSIQSLRTPATRIVTAPVLPITRNTEKFNARAQTALDKNIQKLNWICETSILDCSNQYQGRKRKRKLQNVKKNGGTFSMDLLKSNHAYEWRKWGISSLSKILICKGHRYKKITITKKKSSFKSIYIISLLYPQNRRHMLKTVGKNYKGKTKLL